MKADPDRGQRKFRKNPAAFRLKKSVPMRLRDDVVEYLNRVADEPGA